MVFIFVRDRKELSGVEGGCMILYILRYRYFVFCWVIVLLKFCVCLLWIVGIFSDFVYLLGVKNFILVWGLLYVVFVCVIRFFVFDEVLYYILVEIL